MTNKRKWWLMLFSLCLLLIAILVSIRTASQSVVSSHMRVSATYAPHDDGQN